MRARQPVSERYGARVWRAFNGVFTYLPLAAVISDRVFCVHGGLSRSVVKLEDVESLPLPIEDTEQLMISEMLWSDPAEGACSFVENRYARGLIYGRLAVDDFLAANCLTAILRAHESTPWGCRPMFNGRLITIFSSSGYTSLTSLAGYVRVLARGQIDMMTIGPFERVGKTEVKFAPLRKKPSLCGTR